tara:strand:- start:18 stop:335 length:318 start_codon:yes stop_codon:yes gene_type:complete
MKGIFGNLFSEGLIKKGAAMLGFDMPSWAGTAISIAADTFGGGGGSGSGGYEVGDRYKKAVDLGSSSMGTEQMVGVGEQKASAAVEYEDELRAIHSALGLYARSE